MELHISSAGNIRCLYDETIPLTALGHLHIRRASQVEPDDDGQWWADLSLVHGPLLGPFRNRSQALQAEVSWLQKHRLSAMSPPAVRRLNDPSSFSPSSKEPNP